MQCKAYSYIKVSILDIRGDRDTAAISVGNRTLESYGDILLSYDLYEVRDCTLIVSELDSLNNIVTRATTAETTELRGAIPLIQKLE